MLTMERVKKEIAEALSDEELNRQWRDERLARLKEVFRKGALRTAHIKESEDLKRQAAHEHMRQATGDSEPILV